LSPQRAPFSIQPTLSAALGSVSPESLGGGSVRLILPVPDPDASIARATAAGARAVSVVGNAHGWRVGRIVDPFGHHWETARPLS
jgi:PhnB protein